ncbi:PQQ-binding-like beta-propeller repeat protein [Salinirubrum litoreum]|uniref:PQQ-binding-like beta-propeller repeat protein n=1 Tax=Salinirubrum litoreum TaxID=1126234 RepID=A0ABD5RG66_9EURY|nr:PQQ-binding-like beta-propeller repeat protein [Salinirubrum litoreum]
MDGNVSRRAVLGSVAVGAVGLAGCTQNEVTGSFDHDWPMFQYDQVRTGTNTAVTGPTETPSELWRTDMGAVWGSPVVSDGLLCVPSYDGELHALDAATGDRIWRYATDDVIDGTPAIADGRVYFGGFDRNIHAVDIETGTREWMHETGGYVRSSPTLVDGTLYIGGNCRILECGGSRDLPEQRHGDVFALDPATGDVKWHYKPEKGVISSPAIDGETMYVASSDGVVHALDTTTGEPRWSYEALRLVVSTPAVVDGTVYIGDWGGQVYALDAETGEEQWVFSSNAQYISGSPAVHDGTVYVGLAAVPKESPEGADRPYEILAELVGLSAETGEREWTFRTDATEIGSSPAVTSDALYVGSHSLREEMSGFLYAVSPSTGEELWRHEVPGVGVGSSPAVVDDLVLFGDASGGVVALR